MMSTAIKFYFFRSISFLIGLLVVVSTCSYSYSQNDKNIKNKFKEVYNYFDKQDAVKGLQATKEGVELALNEKDSSSVVTFLYMQSKFYRLDNHIDSAMNSLIKGYLYARKKEDKVKVNNQIGEVLLDIGSYNLAIPYLKEMVSKEENLTSKFYHYNLLGRAYLKNGNKKECIQNFEDQLLVAKKLKDIHLIVNAHNNLGFVFSKYNDFNQAETHFQEVIMLLKTIGKLTKEDKIILSNTYISLANISFQQKKYQECITLFKKSEAISEDNIDYVPVQKLLISSLISLNQTEEAINRLNYLKKIVSDIEEKLVLSNLFISYYIKTNKVNLLEKEINYHNELEKKVTDEIAKNNQKSLDLIGGFYISTAENALTLEGEKYQKLIVEKENSARLFWVIILAGILFISVIVFLFIEKQKRTRIELKLIEKEKENLDISLELKQKDLSKASIDLSERAKIMEEFLAQFKDAAKKDAEEVKAMVVEELKSLNQFNASRITLNQFLEHTDIINTAFHEKLKAKHPDLSQNEIDLCSYIILNISTKDIANLKGIEPNSVRINKTRLKKKIGLTNGNLDKYLNSL